MKTSPLLAKKKYICIRPLGRCSSLLLVIIKMIRKVGEPKLNLKLHVVNLLSKKPTLTLTKGPVL